ncbi:DUF2635 domain-containing protein [Cupriavidus gilardii]|uniref:DUF2635 domain-containing protein n=1 Tax=Cupriavidus gilardii TaxID=82541 RepID=UPI001571CF85|nr:DUF2635 domain-containing protein [Cupriavidus gilardii]NSX04805.1 DUF2635 domain-containing protein [Cupriavidus gilardii]
MEQIRVKAAPAVLVPKEHNPRQYISDAEAQTVDRTAYYLRRLRDGDLVEVNEPNARKRATGGK